MKTMFTMLLIAAVIDFAVLHILGSVGLIIIVGATIGAWLGGVK